MFKLLVVDRLSKQASKSPACPGSCPRESNGDPDDMVRKFRQCRAAQILISGAFYELVSLSLSVASGSLLRMERLKTEKTHRLAQIPLADASASITAEVLGEKREEPHLCIDILLALLDGESLWMDHGWMVDQLWSTGHPKSFRPLSALSHKMPFYRH